MPRMRSLAACSVMWVRSAPLVIVPASQMFRKSRRSVRSKRMMGGAIVLEWPIS